MGKRRVSEGERGYCLLLLTLGVGGLDDLCVGRGVIGLDVGIDGLFYHGSIQLGFG